jgi:hypothetical protein
MKNQKEKPSGFQCLREHFKRAFRDMQGVVRCILLYCIYKAQITYVTYVFLYFTAHHLPITPSQK